MSIFIPFSFCATYLTLSSSGHRQQKIDIYYTFIGEVGATQLVAQLELKGKAA